MHKNFTCKNIAVLPIISLMCFLSSCHSDYIVLDYNLHHGACYNQDSSQIAAIISSRAYFKPSGISRFPDGGRSKYVFEKTGLYMLDLEAQNLTLAVDFSDLTDLIGSYRSSWKTRFTFKDNAVYYQVSPVSDWDFILSYAAKNEKDSSRIQALQEKYDKHYVYDAAGAETDIVDTSLFASCYKQKIEADFSKVNEYLKQIPLSDFGLVLNNIHPKPDKKYIEETIYLKNKSKKTRRAVIEQIISTMEDEEMRDLLDKIEKHKSQLS
ncbi:MAG: hypothetical protein R6V32_06365, partial [Bacteroidales bacterium]